MPVYWRSAGSVITGSTGVSSALDVCKLAMVMIGEDPESVANVTTITSSSKKPEVLCNLVLDTSRRAVLEDAKGNWQFAKRFQQLTYADGYSESGYDSVAITGISQADPCVITAAAHGFLNGQLVVVEDVDGMTEINGRVVRVANKNAGDFECYDLNSAKFTAYVSGGTLRRFEAISDYQNGYAYRVPTDLLKPVALIPEGQFEIIGAGDESRLLCLQDSPVIEYISDFDTVSSMPDHFIRTWAARIAAMIGPAMQKKGASAKDLFGIYELTRNESAKSNARQSDAKSLVRDTSPTVDAGGWE
jgi:hypothetical protein